MQPPGLVQAHHRPKPNNVAANIVGGVQTERLHVQTASILDHKLFYSNNFHGLPASVLDYWPQRPIMFAENSKPHKNSSFVGLNELPAVHNVPLLLELEIHLLVNKWHFNRQLHRRRTGCPGAVSVPHTIGPVPYNCTIYWQSLLLTHTNCWHWTFFTRESYHCLYIFYILFLDARQYYNSSLSLLFLVAEKTEEKEQILKFWYQGH